MARTLHNFGKQMPPNDSAGRRGQLRIAQVTDAGRKRANNEDCIATDRAAGLLVVADGVGGYRSGEIASSIAVAVIVEEVRRGLGSGQQSEGVAAATPDELLRSAIAKANSSVFTRGQDDPDCNGMGTTIVTALFVDDDVVIAHVGDSRLYRLRDGYFTQLTTDHSLIQELQVLVASGIYSKQQVASMNAPRNLVTRALGMEATVEIDVSRQSVRAGDYYLLCTDGLNDMVDDTAIHQVIATHAADLDEAAHRLIELANANGGKDNVSVILAEILESSRTEARNDPGLPTGF